MAHVLRVVRAFAVFCAVAVAAGCGGGSGAERRARTELSHQGVSIGVPDDWDGRILFTDSAGEGAVIFQLANFALPANAGFAPPEALPPGEEDPIKAMAGDDLLLMVATDQRQARERSLPLRITGSSFLPRGSPLIPHGHALAEETGCFDGMCLRVTADFATPPSPDQLRLANDVLASLAVGGGR